MPLETATFTSDLVVTNPAHTDGLNAVDAHLRLIKSALKTTFPNITGAVSATQGALNYITTAGFRGPDGTTGAPVFSFASEPTLGFWRSAAGSVTLTGNFGATGLFGNFASISGNVAAATGTFSGALTAASVSASSASLGALTVTGAAQLTSVTGGFSMPSANASIEMGQVGTTNTPFIDFHSSSSATDFDARIIANGGDAVAGHGTLSFVCANVQYTGSATVSGNQTVSGTLTAGTVVGALAAGAIQDFGGLTAPAGWIECDGAAISRTTYAQLFAYIGTTWGAGDGSTTFNVPNLMDRFRRHRHVGSLAGAVGTLQSPLNLSHTHAVVGNTGGASNGHTHDTSTATVSTTSTAHTHGVSAVSVGGMSANASHTHALGSAQNVFLTSINNGTGTNQGNVMVTGGGVSAGLTTAPTNTDHTHALTGSTDAMSANASHAHTLSGSTGANSADHTHAINFASGATGDANEARPYSATVLTCIKLFN